MKIKNRQQLLLICAVAVVGALAADRLLIRPLTSAWKARSTRIVELRKKVRDGQILIEREKNLRSRWSQMRTNTLPINRPAAEEMVLKGFDRWSQESRVSVLSINPMWKQENDDYITLDCRVEASGSLGAVSRFLYDIERDPMALRIQSIEVTARDNDGQQLALGLQVSALVLLPDNQRAPR